MAADEGLRELFTRAGCRGWLCVAEVDGDGEVAAGADELVAAASVFKVAVALEVFTQANAGRLDPREQIRMPAARHTPGQTGLSVFADDAVVSVRDLATMMLTVSDNAATDMLIDRVGLDSIHGTLASLGLARTVIPAPVREVLDSIGQDAGFAGWADMERAAQALPPDELRAVDQLVLQARALDPQQAIRTTAREMATLLRLIWHDRAGPAPVCAPIRRAMSLQVTRQRLALGFPGRSVQIAAKSGSLMGVIRNEVGVITMPDGRRYAAAVFTRADQPSDNEHQINAAIGAAAAQAVSRLRSQ
jgi:beta-lactamase class A